MMSSNMVRDRLPSASAPLASVDDAPVTHFHLKERSSISSLLRGADAFTITRMESSNGLAERITKVSSGPAVLVAVSAKLLAIADLSVLGRRCVDLPPGAVLPQSCLDLRIPLGHCDERHRLTVPRRVDAGSRSNKSIDDCGVVATARSAMDRSERRPTERRAEMNGIATFDRDASALEDRLYQLDIAHPACCVKRSAPINTPGGFVETEAEHEVRRLATTIENGVSQT